MRGLGFLALAIGSVGYFIAFLFSFVRPISCDASTGGVFFGFCWLASSLFGAGGERYFLLAMAVLFGVLSLQLRRD